MHKSIATDVPVWLRNILKKIDWDGLSIFILPVITALVTNECASLARKTRDYDVENFFTSTPSGILETINLVDFAAISPETLAAFRARIENAVTKHLGVRL